MLFLPRRYLFNNAVTERCSKDLHTFRMVNTVTSQQASQEWHEIKEWSQNKKEQSPMITALLSGRKYAMQWL